jgi:membrane-anchored protein YejM (alkaline phosphatase superfamily)
MAPKKMTHIKTSFLCFTVPFVVLNTLISLYIFFPVFYKGASSGGSWIFIGDAVTFTAHCFMLNFVVGIVGWLVRKALPRALGRWTNVLLFLSFQAFLVIDFQVYKIFHFHINGLVLNLISTEGAGDSVILGTGTVMSFSFKMFVILAIELTGMHLITSFVRGLEGRGRTVFRYVSVGMLIIGVLLMATDKGMFAWADIVNDVDITNNAKLYPLYQPLSLKKFAKKVLGININREEDLDLSRENSLLNYPKHPIVSDAARDRRYNIVLVVLEGSRFDMLTPEIMPNTYKLGRRSIVFDNHYSGGNATRFGVFSLLYGIHGTYWHNVLATRASSVLIDTLLAKDYDFLVLSATRLSYPEFRKTAFIKVPDSITDSWPTSEYPERDRMMTDTFIGFISNRPADEPFFAYLSFNASHQMYKYPKEFEKFTPVVPKDINYFTDADPKNADKIRNRYKNSLYYDDSLIGRMVKALDRTGLIDHSIIIVTGDHGEEFFEHGLMGHTSSFNDYQTRPLFVMHYPGQRPRRIARLTTHIDLVPTLMESLGVTNPPEDYSDGVSLLGDTVRPFVVSSGWDNAALIFPNDTVTFSTETYNMGGMDVRDKRAFKPVENKKAFLVMHRQDFLNFTMEMSEFYR